jgi:hypothetical protein
MARSTDNKEKATGDPAGGLSFPTHSETGDQELSLCITSPNSSQVSPLKRDIWTAWTG